MSRFALRLYSPTDPLRITPRADFAAEHALMGEPLFGTGRPAGPIWTLTEGDRRWAPVLACGGFEPQAIGQDGGRFAAWLYAGDLSPRGWAYVGKAFRRMVVETGARRVEATVRCGPGAQPACRYAVRQGLRLEGRLKAFGPDGGDYWLYAGIF